ncbi:hypothetical protein GCM10009654_62730 [Streptomyces hebeiensis]|uniref:Oxalate:formate antiporter n=1 Tax=Streptomyces hebeiensis TaxID=229486 RepID=A0ABP4FUZ4_9ACTN
MAGSPSPSSSSPGSTAPEAQARPGAPEASRRTGLIVFAWLWVGAPLAYGVYELVLKAAQLFTG